MTHANAPFIPTGRERLARLIVEDSWPIRRAAERFQCSPATAAKWARRYRAGLSMRDRSSRPLAVRAGCRRGPSGRSSRCV
jgi:transposase